MRVNLSPTRIFHLVILTASTYILGQILIHKLDWTPLSAYGFGCTIVVQINNTILHISDTDPPEGNDKDIDIPSGRERVVERRRQNAEGDASSNPKKKR